MWGTNPTIFRQKFEGDETIVDLVNAKLGGLGVLHGDALACEHLDERDQLHTRSKSLFQGLDLLLNLGELGVDPVHEGLFLDGFPAL